jgi:hypothetical protein
VSFIVEIKGLSQEPGAFSQANSAVLLFSGRRLLGQFRLRLSDFQPSVKIAKFWNPATKTGKNIHLANFNSDISQPFPLHIVTGRMVARALLCKKVGAKEPSNLISKKGNCLSIPCRCCLPPKRAIGGAAPLPSERQSAPA